MSSRESLLKGGNSGPAIAPGNPDASLLIQAVRQTHPRIKMPPIGKLPNETIADLETWVRMGAIWPETEPKACPAKQYVITPEQRKFWSFQPVVRPARPTLKNQACVRSAIDAFILAKLESQHLEPVAAANKVTLIRRATLDLHGLPPTPAEVDAFVKDSSPDAFAKVIARLLASPRYGERWGRYWLDVARYSDDQLDATKDVPLPNAFRYRDWVVQAFQEDMPYDLFVKAQIAGDLLEDPSKKLVAGLGFYALSPHPEFHEDRVDATARGFLGLTAACAQCHDHKYDPIPTTDYYSLLGVFENTEYHEIPLATQAEVQRYQEQKKELEEEEVALRKFLEMERRQLLEILVRKTAVYVVAAWQVLGPLKKPVSEAASAASLDPEVLERWIRYLRPSSGPREHSYLRTWDELLTRGGSERECAEVAAVLEKQALATLKEKATIDEKNITILAEAKIKKDKSPPVLSLPRDNFFLLRDLTEPPSAKKGKAEGLGVLYYSDDQLPARLSGAWKDHVSLQRARIAALKARMPPQYPYLRTIRDVAKPANLRVYIAGDKENLGEETPRHFLSILCDGAPPLFRKGSGRLELAEAIASPNNPLTARVMVNRIWEHHFGRGIVRTVGNFGQLGERPTHPELLDYLASWFVENKWSIKAMHREIMLSATYALSAQYSARNYEADPDNRLLWRASPRRLDLEALRDTLLFVSGNLSLKAGGEPAPISSSGNNRRTIYSYVSRRHLDPLMRLFDFPDPNSVSDERITTNVPLQQLFFLNSDFVLRQAEDLAGRLTGRDEDKITEVYRKLFSRTPSPEEKRVGLEFVRNKKSGWPGYTQTLLSSNEFLFVN